MFGKWKFSTCIVKEKTMSGYYTELARRIDIISTNFNSVGIISCQTFIVNREVIGIIVYKHKIVPQWLQKFKSIF